MNYQPHQNDMIDVEGLSDEQVETVRAFAHALKTKEVEEIDYFHPYRKQWAAKTKDEFSLQLHCRVRDSKKQLRPWTHGEAVGKAIKFKGFDQSFLITHANGTAFEFAGYTRSPREVLLYCEQLDGAPCGTEV